MKGFINNMYAILFDEETENVAVYKDFECHYSKNIRQFPKGSVSYDSLIDIGCFQLKELFRKEIIK